MTTDQETATGQKIRQYIRLKYEDLVKIYDDDNRDAIVDYLKQLLYEGDIGVLPFEIAALPSQTWKLELAEPSDPAAGGGGAVLPAQDDEKGLIISIEFENQDALLQFRDRVRTLMQEDKAGRILGIGVDLPFDATHQNWCPGEATQPLFTDRKAALRLVQAGHLGQQGLTGRGVNVVVVDQGVDASQFPAGNFGGGWWKPDVPNFPRPGQSPIGHGTRTVRNILSVAPDATIFDLPLIPEAIRAIPRFLSDAQAAFEQVLDDIAYLRNYPKWKGPWIFVNAWGIFDRKSEFPKGSYTTSLVHPFNKLVDRAVSEGHDMVFGAGNCGQFCPNSRCGNGDVGPGSSIWGANAHPRVITVGAVRTDALWLGYSSQGPGPKPDAGLPGAEQIRLAQYKPDICGPSQFSEPDDAHAANTGTSAACAIAAGVVAALRSRTGWNSTVMPPDELRGVLCDTARKTETTAWDERFGHGIIDAKAAYERALALHP